jgi:magnesium transporter
MSLRVISYTHDELKEITLAEAVSCSGCNKWVSLFAPGPEEFKAVADAFELHPLVVEDMSNEKELPKVNEYAHYTFMILDVPGHDDEFTISKLYIVIGRDFLISKISDWDVLRAVDATLNSKDDPIQKHGIDYLAYALIDRAVDRFYPVLDDVEDLVSDVEDMVIGKPTREVIGTISEVRRYLLKIRKSAWLDREVLSALERQGSPYFTSETVLYIRDVYDHIVQIMDLVETYRDILAASRDTYMSSISNSLNEVMKQLTIIATLMLPLTFISSIYGMNFRHMPELNWEYGYYAVLAVMFLLAAGMIVYFKKRDWL